VLAFGAILNRALAPLRRPTCVGRILIRRLQGSAHALRCGLARSKCRGKIKSFRSGRWPARPTFLCVATAPQERRERRRRSRRGGGQDARSKERWAKERPARPRPPRIPALRLRVRRSGFSDGASLHRRKPRRNPCRRPFGLIARLPPLPRGPGQSAGSCPLKPHPAACGPGPSRAGVRACDSLLLVLSSFVPSFPSPRRTGQPAQVGSRSDACKARLVLFAATDRTRQDRIKCLRLAPRRSTESAGKV